MLDASQRAVLRRIGDIAIVVAFLALTVLGYGVFFISVDQIISGSNGPAFADFYRPGRNPWNNAIIEPASTEERLAAEQRRSR